MKKHRLSVALCTYNGARYLEEQLNSIAGQTCRPDELVVCDDHSADSTAEIIRAFQLKAPFPVHFTVNEENLGSTKNFDKAINLCRGDIIALSDQDDVWQPEKLKLIMAKFLDRPEVGAVFTDAEVVNEYLRPMGYRLWESKGFSPAEQKKVFRGRAFEVLLKHNVVTGATMAFRSDFRKFFSPVPASWVHDGWIALIIAAYADLVIVHEPLIKYRQHLNQQLGAVKKGFYKQAIMSRQTDAKTYISHYDRYMSALERLLKNYNLYPCNREALSHLEEKLKHLKVRSNMPARKLLRLPAILKELVTLRYFRYSNGWKSAARDLLF